MQIPRSSVYYKKKGETEENIKIMKITEEQQRSYTWIQENNSDIEEKDRQADKRKASSKANEKAGAKGDIS